MAKQWHDIPFGRAVEFEATLPNPERTGKRFPSGRWDADYTYREWPNRPSLARTIRMQERRPWASTDWSPVVKLSTTEGY